ncbi:MAG TPA: SOS response-associated peptidase [Gammaproteobacteria bacterium]|nr:SOS response-associated peptidase [Gammaproteobacteria bacterium]
MCGRFALFAPAQSLADYFDLGKIPADLRASLVPRYNVAPGQALPVIRSTGDGQPKLGMLRWGLVPYWAKDRSIGYRLINARAETLAAKPAFREAAARRRCLIAASGFYEWAKGANGAKQPFFVSRRDGELLAFAGLWERWRGAGEPLLETCVIVTTEANSILAPIHERMPVVLGREDQSRWLDPATSIESCLSLARSSADFRVWPVGARVNDTRYDEPQLIEPQN